jgi:PAS domain S-box-containing protein
MSRGAVAVSPDAPGKPPLGTPHRGVRAPAQQAAASFADARAAGDPQPEDAGLYRLLVDSIRDYAIFALDATGHVLSWNEGAQHIKGYAPHEIIGRHFSTFYTEEDLAAGKPAMELEVATREGRYEEEGWRLRKDGSTFWANVVITALRDPGGELVGFAKVTRNLTERRAAEEAVRESEQRFRLLVHSVRDYGIFMLDPDGRIASWNEGAQRIQGYSADEIIGRHFSTFYTEEDLAAGKPAMELEVATREGRYEEEGWRVRRDGTTFWSNVIITALRSEDGALVGFAKVTRDLTERRAAAERALADARRVGRAEEANRTKSEFLAAMSHELRTPLNAIGGYVELIEMGIHGPVTEEQRKALERVQQSQRHLLSIITDLLNYSRIEAGQVTYAISTVPMHDVVDAVFPLLEPQAAGKDITLVHGPCQAGLDVHADRLKAQQIVLNLLSNAVKFTLAGGRVEVGCSAEADRVRVTVRDTGPGIPPEMQGAIFEPFIQLGRSLTSAHEGTGLGLAISRDLARAMGGDITVQSVVDEGSTFTLSLPSAASERDAAS